MATETLFVHFPNSCHDYKTETISIYTFQATYAVLTFLFGVINFTQSDSIMSSASNPSPRKCRARSAEYDKEVFVLKTCADCYTYLFPVGKELKAYDRWLVSLNGSIYPHLHMLVPNIHNSTNRKEICKTLNRYRHLKSF